MNEIEARNYTYCSAFYSTTLEHRHYVVMTPDRGEARQRAEAFAADMWGQPTHVSVYPRNYITKARALYAAGYHD
jgi:hypothetical protein